MKSLESIRESMHEPKHDALAITAAQPAPADRPDPARRGFLKAAPLGALAVVAATPAAATPPPVAAAPDPNVKRGYHETDHIRRYYQTAAYW